MNETKNSPQFIYRQNIATDEEYVRWLGEVKQRFRNTQLKAAAHVNNEMLRFYWSVGRDLYVRKMESKWGAGIVKQFALDMRNAFPGATGFSDTNVKYMKRWFLFYTKSHQPGDFLEMPDNFALYLGDIMWIYFPDARRQKRPCSI